ncbi:unnamed protein product [Miscanthus lutarioriparius]|uniref:Uncharacterized protein n=1 Tax=Miscanthus lutarioriparius TaxID=422564 RepID=A0A811P2V5_9POAL|nr:unnamed protein product [Miscanthus lutarioriparius]
MAAEAQAEGPALPPAPPPPLAHGSSSASPEKRGLPIPGDDGGADEEERRLPAPSVAALDSVPSSVTEEEAEDSPGSACGGDGDGDGDGASFSFQHARGGFVALETTPKFGSFNPPGETELAGLDLKPAAAGHEADPVCSTEADDEVPAASVPGEEAKDESSQLRGGEVDGQVQA